MPNEMPDWMQNIYYTCKRNLSKWYWDIREYPKRKYQRLTRGFDYRELWNLDYTIAKFVAPRLRHFRNYNALGVTPGCMIKFDEKTGMPLDDPENLAHKEWLNILDKMLYSFEHLAKEGDWDLSLNGIENGDIISGNLKWEQWSNANKIHHEKMNEGFELFGRYLGALWD